MKPNPLTDNIGLEPVVSSYYHFNQRLVERYGMSVTIDEYRELCTKQIKTLVNKTGNKSIGIIEIQGVHVLVAKERKRNRRLITALSPKKKEFFKNKIIPHATNNP